MHSLPESPYVGLVPFSDEDAPFFFGRDLERETIIANLWASRLTLLYGTSGVGKSSVLQAGVAHRLKQLAEHNLEEYGSPEFAVVVFNTWRDDPVASLLAQVNHAVSRAWGNHTVDPVPASRRLDQMLEAWAERAGSDLFVILDQFEEYFLYHPREDGAGSFFVEFPRAVNRRDLRVHFLISIREDALAKLDRFKGRIPNLFKNYLRIEHLDREAARDAIKKPLEEYNRRLGVEAEAIDVEEQLVESVLDQVRTGQVVVGAQGRGAIEPDADPAEERIETPFLQLVMTRLWDREMQADSRVLRDQTLYDLGGAEGIVRMHLDAEMKELEPDDQQVAASIFHYLVTPSGAKIAHTVQDLADWAELPKSRVARVLDKLSGREVRILREVAAPPQAIDAPPTELAERKRYEIFHDVLAPAILAWLSRFEQRAAIQQAADDAAGRERGLSRQRELEQTQKSAMRLRLLAAALAVMFVLAVAVAVAAVLFARQSSLNAVAAAMSEQEAIEAKQVAEVAATVAEERGQIVQEGLATQEAQVMYAQSTADAVATAQAVEALATPTPMPATPTAIPGPAGSATPPPKVTPTPTRQPPTSTPNRAATATTIALEAELKNIRATQTAVAEPLHMTIDSYDEYVPSYSPDQKSLLIESNRTGEWQIYLLGAEGGDWKRLTEDGSHNHHPRFSPSGDQIVFSSDRDRDGDRDIYVMAADGSELRRLTDVRGDDVYPSYSSDGKQIIFMSERDGTWGIFIMWADGSDQRAVIDSIVDEVYPSLSPDGQSVAFQSDRRGNWDLFLVPLTGGAIRQLTDHQARDAQPIFSPDGRLIVFETNRDGNYEVYALDLESGALRNLTNSPYRDQVPSVSPDGRWVVFQSKRSGSWDIYRIPFYTEQGL